MPPILPLLLAVIAGILLPHFFNLSPVFWWGLLGVLCICAFYRAPFRAWPIFFGVVCIAALRFSWLHDQELRDPLKGLEHQKVVIQFYPVDDAGFQENPERFVAHVTANFTQGEWKPLASKVLVSSTGLHNKDAIIIAEGKLDSLPRKYPLYHNQGCHHVFQVLRVIQANAFHRKAIFLSTIGKSVHRWISKSLPFPYNSVAAGIFFGDHRQVPKEMLDEFRVTGTYHLLVASGLKIGITAAVMWGLTWFVPFHMRLMLVAAAIAVYADITALEPPVLRAALMAVLGFTAFLLGRGKDSTGAFFLTAFILLLVQPGWLFDVGFQLSFLAVLGILLFYEKLTAKLDFIPKWMADSISITLSAQLLILVPLALYFHNISFIAPVSNLFTVPLSGLSMLFSAASFVSSLFFKPLGFALSFWHQQILRLIISIVHFTSRVPLAYLWVGELSIWSAGIIYLSIIGFFFLEQKFGKILFVSCSAAAGIMILWRFFNPPLPRIAFLDVGQGDSALLSVNSFNYLIDGGGSGTETDPGGFSVGENILVPALRSHGVNKLNGILLTHPHQDHVGGLVAVVKHFPVEQIWLPDLKTGSPVYALFLKEASGRGIPLHFIAAGQKISLFRDVSVYFFWPPKTPLEGTGSYLNNNSAVSQLQVGQIKILLSGDVELEGEEGLLQHLHPRNLLQSQILKVPHHGSSTSSTADFLKAVSPQVGVVSVGASNLYHHPSPKTMQRLRRFIPYIYRTDQDGTVEFVIHSNAAIPWIERKRNSSL